MSKYDYDLFVIGAGSGGVRAARIAGGYGARVAVAENRYLGGTCVNVGCVPKKLLVYAAHFSEDFEDAAGFGWSVGPRDFSWRRLIENKDAEIARLNGVYRELLEGAKVEIFEATARLLDAHTVEVGEHRVTAETILIATGGWPHMPEIPGIEHAITSNEVFHLDALPERAIVVGGGYISVEFSGILHGLGVAATQLYRGPLFMRGFDGDVRVALAEEMAKKGVDLRFNADIRRIDRRADGTLAATLADGAVLEADLILYATGRRPSVTGLGLEAVGVELSRSGAIAVDDHGRSSVPNIYAVGDVTDRIQLTPVAIAEGHAFAETVFNDNPTIADRADVPSAVFSQPPVGTVGLTEEEARARLGAIRVFKSQFRPMKHTLTGRDERTMMKLVVEEASDRVVGVHMVGPEAGEMIQGFAVAMKAGATKRDFDRTIGIHPTSAEEFVTMRTPVPEPEREAAE